MARCVGFAKKTLQSSTVLERKSFNANATSLTSAFCLACGSMVVALSSSTIFAVRGKKYLANCRVAGWMIPRLAASVAVLHAARTVDHAVESATVDTLFIGDTKRSVR